MIIKYKKNQNICEVLIKFEIPRDALEYQGRIVKSGLDNFLKDRVKMELFSKTLLDLIQNLNIDADDFVNLLMIYAADLTQISVKMVCDESGIFEGLLEKQKEEGVDEITIASLVLSLIEVLRYKGYKIEIEENKNSNELQYQA
ncbi:MAG: hypothetical protein NZ923_07340 [Candidatus Kryptonium sp.]|nr:hypothetical protein [Candidatus Kryptonium sp.]